MAVALVGSGSSFSTTSDGFTSGSFDTTGANFIVVHLSETNDSAKHGAVTDSKGNTWTQVAYDSAGRLSSLWYAYNATVGTAHTFTVSGTGNFPAITIGWFSGVQSASTPVDQSGIHNVNLDTTVSPGPITPTTGNQLLVSGVAGASSANTGTVGSPHTRLVSVTDTAFGHEQSVMGYEIQTTAASSDPLLTPGGWMLR